MRIRKFVASTLPEAMAQVKSVLGPDAVILHTNQVRVGGIFGLFGSRRVQVMAAVESAEVQPAPPARPVTHLQTEPAAALATDVASVKSMVNDILQQVNLPPERRRLEPGLRPILTRLIDSGVHEREATAFVNRVGSRCRAEGGAHAEVARRLMVQELGRVRPVGTGQRIVALVGPTGVGKTTTLAKLAAHFALHQHLRVGLITTDTYRIAAVDQLRAYSDILGLPLEVVYEAGELPAAVQRLHDREVILVDTAGRSPRHAAHMEELKVHLSALRPDVTFLVISMTLAYHNAINVVESYLPMGFDRFLFTKWDEAIGPGLLYQLVHKYKRPLSYVTTGQSVPDDIEVVNPAKVTQAILGD